MCYYLQVKNLEHEKSVLQDRVWELENIERHRDRGGGEREENRRLQMEVSNIGLIVIKNMCVYLVSFIIKYD